MSKNSVLEELRVRRLAGCMSETCCTRLAEITVRKNRQKFAIWALSHNFVESYLRNEGKYQQSEKLVKQQYLLRMYSQYGELWPTSAWDRFVSLGTSANFNGFRVLAALLHGTLVVGVSQTAALNRGCHLPVYYAGQPPHWALAHILIMNWSTNHINLYLQKFTGHIHN